MGHTATVAGSAERSVNGPLERLIDAWCERRELRPLALMLPGYTSNAGLTDDWVRVIEALHDVRAQGHPPEDEQQEVERLVPIVEQMVYRAGWTLRVAQGIPDRRSGARD
jgi:hypothetical protein